ncbi:DNA-methyltransferase [Iodobacter ciconiae]|uniref:Methyltransferase n=1 Tax=Iodobacter ciconiae TaxID=2496266 RepID=A0A3S8ZPX1_9NEIS|nr:site-specific DNA-methyltransferase [Iodobacter ciconiae]AZN35523.1 site-specific DNA-methyltransferase [Iodobacter ciconiae]
MKNKLHSGDSLPFLESLPAALVDALITDPPYASGGLHIGSKNRSTSDKYQNGGTARKYPEFTGDHRDQRTHLRWMTLWLAECLRVMKDGAPICLFTDWRQLPLTTDALQIAGFTWRGIAVWDKGEGVRPQMGRYRNQAEYIVWGSKGQMPNERDVGVLRGVYKEVVKQKDKFHVTGKPTDLMRDLIKICKPGGLILDPFAGSGSTLVAAQMEGYHWLGCELSEEYKAIAIERLAQLKGHS